MALLKSTLPACVVAKEAFKKFGDLDKVKTCNSQSFKDKDIEIQF